MIRNVAPRRTAVQPRLRAKRITARTSPGVVYEVSTYPGELAARLTRSAGPLLRGLAARVPEGGSTSNATDRVTTRRPSMSSRQPAFHWYATPSTTIRRFFDFMRGMAGTGLQND